MGRFYLRIDTRARVALDHPPGARIRGVTAGETVLHAGHGDFPANVRLPAGPTTLAFEYAVIAYAWPAGNRARIMLDGYDPAWSAWQPPGIKEYTSLPAGTYHFRMQARDVYGRIRESKAFGFEILPPWYRTWPSLVLGGLLLALFVPALLRLAMRRQTARTRQLERLVDQRTAELRQQQRLLRTERDKLDRLSRIDELTGLYKRRHLNHALTEALDSDATATTVAVVDIDRFKRINDTYSHDVGDRVLRRLAVLLRAGCRDADVVARWGGEEFVILFTGAGLAQARAICERLRASVESEDWSEIVPDQPVTISIGLAESRNDSGQRDLLVRADQQLYAAKRAGRNRVCAGDGDTGLQKR